MLFVTPQEDSIYARILFRYIDRLNDPTPEDPLEKIVGEMDDAIEAVMGKQL